LSAKEISKKLKIHCGTVSDLAKKHNLNVNKDGGYHYLTYSLSQVKNALSLARGTNAFNQKFLNPFPTKIYDDYWKLPWNEFIVGADAHAPYFDEKIVNKMIQVAQHYGIKNFLHGGDYFNQDQFSTWWVAKDDLVKFSHELTAAKKLGNVLTNNFKDCRFFIGSHDARLWRLMSDKGKDTGYDDVWEQLENKGIKTSSYRYAEVNTEWRINHPKNVVRVGGLPAIRMSAKFERSVIFGHGHWQGFVWGPSGKHILAAPGCLCNPKKFAYKCNWDTSHDEWVPGFALILEKTKMILFNHNSPWGIYLR
jgi:hypothetical protein